MILKVGGCIILYLDLKKNVGQNISFEVHSNILCTVDHLMSLLSASMNRNSTCVSFNFYKICDCDR